MMNKNIIKKEVKEKKLDCRFEDGIEDHEGICDLKKIMESCKKHFGNILKETEKSHEPDFDETFEIYETENSRKVWDQSEENCDNEEGIDDIDIHQIWQFEDSIDVLTYTETLCRCEDGNIFVPNDASCKCFEEAKGEKNDDDEPSESDIAIKRIRGKSFYMKREAWSLFSDSDEENKKEAQFLNDKDYDNIKGIDEIDVLIDVQNNDREEDIEDVVSEVDIDLDLEKKS